METRVHVMKDTAVLPVRLHAPETMTKSVTSTELVKVMFVLVTLLMDGLAFLVK
jgi:hypothetical protein